MNLISKSDLYTKKLLNRFVSYVKIWSESSEEQADKGIFPSTPQQFDFAKILEKELKTLGLQEVQLTKDCYVYGYLPASKGMENISSVMLMAHMDTVDEVTGKNVNPQIFESYDGRKICLKENIILDPQTDKYLKLAGEEKETIVTTDGTTLLGADDKAGITAIMTALEYLAENPETAHRAVEVMFSPDEETGHGMDKVPLELFNSKCAYTVDGGHLGELETECFNAWSADVTFTGKACHTGTAKEGHMVNAAILASNFVALLPRNKAPETTEKYEGFIAPMGINGSIESASIHLLLRSFYIEEIEQEKKIIQEIAEKVAANFGGKVTVEFNQQYLNMKEKLEQHPEVKAQLAEAFEAAGVPIVNTPIRGGTDGSRLTEMGIPTPNIFTGAHNFHSRSEWLSLNQCCKSSDILLNLLTQIK
ncbi:MAG: peptidase T [Treponema sp.]|nr:peptidase T [Treponema sp.]